MKIGYTAGDALVRLADLQCGSPDRLRLLSVVDGDRAYERQLHEHFDQLREHGEWFRLDHELATFCNANRSTMASLAIITRPGRRAGPFLGPLREPHQRVLNVLERHRTQWLCAEEFRRLLGPGRWSQYAMVLARWERVERRGVTGEIGGFRHEFRASARRQG